MTNLPTITPALIFGALLAWGLEWLPGLRTWFDQLSPSRKAMVNGLGVAVTSVLAMLGNCYWWGSTCPASIPAAIGEYLLVALLSLGVNQGAYRAARKELFGIARWSDRRAKSSDY
jgi:hypothetical protein